MSKKEDTLETIMTREVKALYFDSMRSNGDFFRKPFLDMDWFKRHFAAVAHRHGIFHRDSQDSRNQYNMYFRLVRARLSESIKRLVKNEREHHPPVIPIGATKNPPNLEQSPLSIPPRPIPESFRRWYQEFKARQSASH